MENKIVIKNNGKKICELDRINPKFDDLIKYVADNRTELDNLNIEMDKSKAEFDYDGFESIIIQTIKSFKSKSDELEKLYTDSLTQIKK